MGKLMRLLVIGLLICSPWTAHTDEDFDTEVEESMAESDATTVQAKFARERALKEAAEAERLKSEAKAAKVDATEKLKQSGKELAEADKEIVVLVNEQHVYKKEKAEAERKITEADKKLKAALARVQKLKGENEALRKLRQDQAVKLAAIDQKTKAALNESVKLQNSIQQSKKDFAKDQAKVKVSEAKLKEAQVAYARKKVATAQEIEKLKLQHMDIKRKTAHMEEEIRMKQQGISKLNAEAQVAQGEVNASAAKMASVQGTITRGPASVGAPGSVFKYKLAKKCQVYEKPDGSSKVLGSKDAGWEFSGQKGQHWTAFKTKSGRSLYVPNDCF